MSAAPFHAVRSSGDPLHTATAMAEGNAINVVVPGDSLKPLVWLFVATLLALAITLPVSAFAIFTAIHANIAAETYASDKRVTENHVMHLEAELDVLKKETTNARSYTPTR